MNGSIRTRLIVPLLFAAGAFASHNAYAFPCQYGFVSGESVGESGVYSCEDGTDKNHWSDLDGQTLFGHDDWGPIQKTDADGTEANPGEDYDFTVTVDSSLEFGTWSFSADLWTVVEEVLIVIKDGKETSSSSGDVTWSAYLVTPQDNGIDDTGVVGVWDMGTECNTIDCSDNNIPREVSNIGFYARGEGFEPPAGIPEPSTLALFGIGLLGVGLSGLRRRRGRD